MKLQDVVNLGREVQIRKVLTIMGPERIEAGLTAFEDGASNWSHCFFARAYPDLALDSWGDLDSPEIKLMKKLDLPTRIPIRIVYCLFDGAGDQNMNRKELHEFVRNFLDEQRPPEVSAAINDLLTSLDNKFTEAGDLDNSVWANSCKGIEMTEMGNALIEDAENVRAQVSQEEWEANYTNRADLERPDGTHHA